MKYFFVLLLGLTLGCSSRSTQEKSLTGTTWALVQYTDSAGTSSSVTYPHGKKDDGYWVGFRQDTIYGSDNCNHFSGTYQISNAALTTANLLSTLIGCPDNVEMIAALSKAKSFEFVDSRLHIYTNHPKLIILVFERLA